MHPEQNPFPETDPDRRALWEMLVQRDIDAFITQNWGMVSTDFTSGPFFGLHGNFCANPDDWRLAYPSVAAYREEWLAQARETANTKFGEPLRDALFRATSLLDIDVQENRAVLHKKFNGTIQKQDGDAERLNWQTLYFCAKSGSSWQITGFVGYIPFPLEGFSNPGGENTGAGA